jgi:hypothetical protein
VYAGFESLFVHRKKLFQTISKMEQDLEKASDLTARGSKELGKSETTGPEEEIGSSSTIEMAGWKRWLNHFETVTGIESRGIQRVPPDERYETSFVQMLLLWLSANLTANNTMIGVLGPIAFGLGFTDAALCAVFGGLVGCAGVAYMGTWGPQSGNRTLVCFCRSGLHPSTPAHTEMRRLSRDTSWATTLAGSVVC